MRPSRARTTHTTWRARLAVCARPEHVIEVLTDPDACRRWSPVGFDVHDLEGERLSSGSRATVTGHLHGWPIRFTVHVFEVASYRLYLRAIGPVEMLVDYAVTPAGRGSAVDAAISIAPRAGYRAALTAHLTGLLLRNGGLDRALREMAREAERRQSSRVTTNSVGRRP